MSGGVARRAANLLRSKLLFDLGDTAAVHHGSAVCAYWSCHAGTRLNFGDAINPLTLEYLTGKQVIHSDRIFYFGPWPTVYCIGSILDNLSQPNSVIAGAGFKWPNARIFRKPKQIIAVRGPLTKSKFESLGISCPSLFCDPGLLISKIIRSGDQRKSFDFGIIPHYVDKSHSEDIKVSSRGKTYRWIDIEGPPSQVVSDILSCRSIVSSSLHGIITAHAYGIPAAWMQISGLIGGNGFKFHDYYSSLGVSDPRHYDATYGIDLTAVEEFCGLFETDRLVNDYLHAFPPDITKSV